LLPTEASLEAGVLALSAYALEVLLTSEVVEADEFLKYRSLQARCGEITPDGGSQEISCKEQEERSFVAKDVAKSIDFCLIKASDLASIRGSNLVVKGQLYDAFKQAQAPKRKVFQERQNGATNSFLQVRAR
jgi:hypothetical protein